jgi:hypothetical protein
MRFLFIQPTLRLLDNRPVKTGSLFSYSGSNVCSCPVSEYLPPALVDTARSWHSLQNAFVQVIPNGNDVAIGSIQEFAAIPYAECGYVVNLTSSNMRDSMGCPAAGLSKQRAQLVASPNL